MKFRMKFVCCVTMARSSVGIVADAGCRNRKNLSFVDFRVVVSDHRVLIRWANFIQATVSSKYPDLSDCGFELERTFRFGRV